MITYNIIYRVFHISYCGNTGTAFTLDHNDRQYLVTAFHVLDGIGENENIQIKKNGAWIDFEVKIVGTGGSSELADDFIILSLQERLSPPNYLLKPSTEGLIWGQDVFFLGFPYALQSSATTHFGFPMPLVKKALLSGHLVSSSDNITFLLDGHNNPGFSGGPVVFRPQNNLNAEFQILGLVSAYQTENVAIFDQEKDTDMVAKINSGIVFCPSIKKIVEVISNNEIGLQIDDDSTIT